MVLKTGSTCGDEEVHTTQWLLVLWQVGHMTQQKTWWHVCNIRRSWRERTAHRTRRKGQVLWVRT